MRQESYSFLRFAPEPTGENAKSVCQTTILRLPAGLPFVILNEVKNLVLQFFTQTIKDEILRHFVPQNDRRELCVKLQFILIETPTLPEPNFGSGSVFIAEN